jgi:Tfp pilus assembly protein PilV
LVEMMVAVMIMAVGLLGLASTAAYVVRQVTGGAQQSIAANVVQSRIEWLRSMPCASIKDSSAVTRGVKEKWVRGTTSNMVLSVVDTVRYSVAGSPKEIAKGTEKMLTYTIMVPCW